MARDEEARLRDLVARLDHHASELIELEFEQDLALGPVIRAVEEAADYLNALRWACEHELKV